MKHHLLTLSLILGCLACAPQATAQDAPSAKPDSAAAPAEGNAVGEALKGIKKFVTSKKPNTQAKYYIFLESASWCGPCNMEMPIVVKQYKAMKMGKKVELILVSHDSNADAAVKFMKKYGGDFPCILANSGESGKLPGFKMAGGIPNASVVKANGKEVANAHAGEIIGNWKKYTRK